jgi:hypothetical protein
MPNSFTAWKARPRKLVRPADGEYEKVEEGKRLAKEGKADAASLKFGDALRSESLWLIVEALDAMRLHLQRSDQGREAVAYGIAHRVARVQLYRAMHDDDVADLDWPVEGEGWWIKLLTRSQELARNNLAFSEKWIRELSDPEDIDKLVSKLDSKAGWNLDRANLVAAIVSAIDGHTTWRDMLSRVQSML